MRAALYLRSSKDRSDVSIDAQRRGLRQLAAERGLTIVAEFADAVESGKDEDRPGFQRLLSAMRDHRRGWDTLLVLDTSRIARRRHIAIVFEEVEAKRHAVRVVYKSLPDSDPITEMLLKSILQAMDEWHSLTSRAKGLAGMAENVRKGFRAGGRAPFGYQLQKTSTGAMREGLPVTKSRLVPDDNLPLAGRYLALRAEGMARAKAAERVGMPLSLSTLVSTDWTALTYAGHTVWNMHQERIGGAHKGGRKRRPRGEWMIQRDTHPAVITDDQAELIVRAMETSDRAEMTRIGRSGKSDYLLTGLLFHPNGTPWEGSEKRYYKLRGEVLAHERADGIDAAVTARMLTDLRSEELAAVVAGGGKAARSGQGRKPALHREIIKINEQIGRAMDAALQLADAGPAYRKIDELERRRKALVEEQLLIEAESEQARAARAMTPARVSALLKEWADRIEMLERDVLNRIALKEAIRELVGRIELDPADLSCRIDYRIKAINPGKSRESMASPRGFEPRLPP